MNNINKLHLYVTELVHTRLNDNSKYTIFERLVGHTH
jgi:hypothetical protein